MITINKGSNRVIKLHFKNDSKSLDITNKIILVNIKSKDSVINKTIEKHDFADDGLTHFILSNQDTEILDGDCAVNLSIIDRQQ